MGPCERIISGDPPFGHPRFPGSFPRWSLPTIELPTIENVHEVLAVENLTKRYSEILAVDDVSFSVARNEIVGLLGPNGAGKTTTISMILGVLEPTCGRIAITGIDLGRYRKSALQKANFSAVYAPLPGNLTVLQNLRVFGLIYGVLDLKARIETAIKEFDLERFRDKK